ncbi:MAG: AraC family transcriptional regulator [Clostridiales bacterium]|nr:AraC family transcriptional regulator [Clostridiales bacterium]
MNWANSIQNAINYIEEHLTENIDYDKVAKEAASSSFYFQKIFGILCGYSLGEYIRNRRLTLAGKELASSRSKVIDVALKYGYTSPESFTRAFTKFHGITPADAKKNGSQLKTFSRLSVSLILKGGSIMNYKLVEKEAFTVLEKVEPQEIDDSVNKNSIPAFWERSHQDGTVKTLIEKTTDKSFIFGICYNNAPTDIKTFDYSIAAVCDKDIEIPKGFRINDIPARSWLVFDCIGPMPEAIQDIWHKITAEFFPTSDYIPTYEMDIEAYPATDMNSEDYKSEIWIPVKKS